MHAEGLITIIIVEIITYGVVLVDSESSEEERKERGTLERGCQTTSCQGQLTTTTN